MKRLRVYGLPRSGTNFVEYLIRHNLDCDYRNEYANSKYMKGGRMAMKHGEPTRAEDVSGYVLVLKSWSRWKESFARWNKRSGIKMKPFQVFEVYSTMIDDYANFYQKDDTVIAYYEDILTNEEEFMEHVGKTFGIPLITDFMIPENRLDRSGGQAMLTSMFDRTPIQLESISTRLESLLWRPS
jgi:hypothetical protein